MRKLKCEIICVGTELLLGDIVNTNSQYISEKLSEIGIDVYYHTSVGDNFERILGSLKNSFENKDINLIITSGGLGPTDDDLTKEVCSAYFNLDLLLNEDCLDDLRKIVGEEGLNKGNLKQVYIPEGCVPIKNHKGTAPGVIFDFDDKIIINLPGPPCELYTMFEEYVVPYLKNYTDKVFYSEFLRLSGIPESNLNEILKDLFSSVNPSLAPYAKDNDLVLRLTSNGISEEECIELIKPLKDKVYNKVSKFIYSEGTAPIEERLVKELTRLNYKISTVESCTGGMVSSTIVNFPGASKVFNEGFITYSNESKVENILCNMDTINKFGAVSKETSKEMVEGLYKKTKSEVCISITGVAGPFFSENKPVGLVYIGIKIKDNIYIREYNFNGDRYRIRNRTTFIALLETYKLLKHIK